MNEPRSIPHDVFVFPDYRRDNSYQEHMYASLNGPFTVRYGGVDAALEHLRQVGAFGRVVMHLHWEDAVYRAEPSERAARAACAAFLSALIAFVDEGGRLLWTVHNEASHEAGYEQLHRGFTAEIARLADRVHFHCHRSAARFVRDGLIAPEKVVIAAHGNYLPAYDRLPEPGAREQARAALGLPEGFCVLLFGRLSAYKGAATLLEAIDAIGDQSVYPLLAGRQIHPLGPAMRSLSPATRERVRVIDGFVPKETTPLMFAAADVVALPYTRSLTSGTMMLALSLGRPVIAPDDDHPMEVLEDGVSGFIYRRAAPNGLQIALERAMSVDLAPMRLAALETAHRYDWRATANLLAGVMHELAALPRPHRLPAAPAGVISPTPLSG